MVITYIEVIKQYGELLNEVYDILYISGRRRHSLDEPRLDGHPGIDGFEFAANISSV